MKACTAEANPERAIRGNHGKAVLHVHVHRRGPEERNVEIDTN